MRDNRSNQRNKVLGRQVAGGLFLLVLFLCLIQLDHRMFRKSLHVICDAGHFPMFAVFAFGLTFAWSLNDPPRLHRKMFHFLRAVILSSFFAATIEIIQPYFNRSRELGDYIVGTIGAGFGALLAILVISGAKPRAYFAPLLCGAIFSAYLLQDVPFAYEADRYLEAHFPLLGDFEDQHETLSWVPQFRHYEPQAAQPFEGHATSGKFSLELKAPADRLNAEEYEADLQDWSKFSTLRFEVFNPGDDASMFVLLTDRPRFLEPHVFSQTKILVPHGQTSVAVPLAPFVSRAKERELHLDRIRTLVIGYDGAPEKTDRVVYVDAVRLE